MKLDKFKINLLKECGYEESLFGLSLNKDQKVSNMKKVANRLCDFDGGHNKFLEHIITWIDITAPRYMWSQMDTYRMASKSSQSTMHTILDNELTQNHFEDDIQDDYLEHLNLLLSSRNLQGLKSALPEGFLQRRLLVVSYKTLKNIIQQRHNHKLAHWRKFCIEITKQIEHPELLQIQ